MILRQNGGQVVEMGDVIKPNFIRCRSHINRVLPVSSSCIMPCLMVLNEADKKNVSPDPSQVQEVCK